MHLWHWILFLFLWIFASAFIAEISKIPLEYIFFGIPVLVVAATVIVPVIGWILETKAQSREGGNRKARKQADSNKLLFKRLRQIAKERNPDERDALKEVAELISETNGDCTSEGVIRRLEGIYLALQRKKTIEAITPILEEIVVSPQALSEPEEHKKYRPIIVALGERLLVETNQAQLDDFILNRLLPDFLAKPSDFPTDLTSANAALIPDGSFLESEELSAKNNDFGSSICSEHFTLSELREEFSRIERISTDSAIEDKIKSVLEGSKSKATRSIHSALEKNKLTATDLRQFRRWCVTLALRPSAPEISFALSAIKAILARTETSKQTQAVKREAKNLQDLYEKLETDSAVILESEVDAAEKVLKNLASERKEPASNDNPKFYADVLDASYRVLSLPQLCQRPELVGSLIRLLRDARLSVAQLEDRSQIIDLSEKLSNALKAAQEATHSEVRE